MSANATGLTSRERAEVCANFPCSGRATHGVIVKDELKIRLCGDCLRNAYPDAVTTKEQTNGN